MAELKADLKSELESLLRDRKTGSECQAMIKLINWHLERTKHNLISAAPDAVQLLQGEAKAYYNMLKMFSRELLPTQQ